MAKYYFLNGQIYTDDSVYIPAFKPQQPFYQPCVFILTPKQPKRIGNSIDEEKNNVEDKKEKK
jgi:hypothetical protein